MDTDPQSRDELTRRLAEARFRELADSAPVMIWTTDEQGDVTFINSGWLGFTGTSLAEELGDTWDLGVHPEDADRVVTTWQAALRARRPWELEYRLRAATGEYRWIVDRGIPRFEEGEFVGYVGTATDIHERKSVEERLRTVLERERRVAETLQRSMLPEELPELEGLELAARYLPAQSEAAVGGDWYDVFELADGRVALVVGDVVGHGVRAAAVMGQLRNALRAYAVLDDPPTDIVARLGRLLTGRDREATATLAFVALDRRTGELTFTCAGHPPPLLIERGRARFLSGGRSLPVGAGERGPAGEERAVLAKGSTVLLYTDGLVERRDAPLEERLERLAAAAGVLDGAPAQLVGGLLAEMLPVSNRDDDVAVLAARRSPA